MSWQERAECADRSIDGIRWLTEPTASGRWDSAEHRRAKSICYQCPVRRECLEYSLQFEKGLGPRSRYGIWGAATPDERARLSKQLTAVSA